ncbi:uncharacterized protein IL334_007121 [Kwoniella shivajii]|uniref:Transmembrane protein n=1 Tax=Kwoniella shivajii TaxID=564305 RepID=A0ABZ1D958_9TREE|nr:hypothetical protein IL334_007121 [Kwoniella shivajii]
MVILRILFLFSPFLLCITASPGLFSEDTSSDSSASTSSSSSSSSTSASSSGDDSSQNVNEEVGFLLTLQAAQVSSMSCLISLVNMTTSPIGACLGLTDLSNLISNPSGNQSFSTQLETYLDNVCKQNCDEEELKYAKSQLETNCDTSNGFINVLNKIFERYTASYKTVACQVHFNGTSDLCLPSTLNTSDAANNNGFFDSLVTGSNLDQYTDSVFRGAKCSGCMHEMFKAAQYTIPNIRGTDLVNVFGGHLKQDCPNDPSNPGNIDWSCVDDQQIPQSLQISQNTAVNGQSSSAFYVATPQTIRQVVTILIVVGGIFQLFQ